jgi:hypothetical protein
MKMSEKIIQKILAIIKVNGFYIRMPGDPSTGIADREWKLEGEFYFDDKEELELFKFNLKQTFEIYCGEISSIETFKEYQARINSQEK